jgi:hypothetical protein
LISWYARADRLLVTFTDLETVFFSDWGGAIGQSFYAKIYPISTNLTPHRLANWQNYIAKPG